MSRVQVLVASMHQKDDSLYRDMNLQTDAILANQCDEYFYQVFTEQDGSKVELISTADVDIVMIEMCLDLRDLR